MNKYSEAITVCVRELKKFWYSGFPQTKKGQKESEKSAEAGRSTGNFNQMQVLTWDNL
jgi:hypothetical protein